MPAANFELADHDADPRERGDECTAGDALLLRTTEHRRMENPATAPSLVGVVWLQLPTLISAPD